MQPLPHNLYRADQVRELDRIAIEEEGIPGAILMGRAGAAAFALLRGRWPGARRLAVLCGVGNNGGDGYVVARLALEAGLGVQVLQAGDGGRLGGDALEAARAARAAGVPVADFDSGLLDGCDLLVDALLGTGLSGEVRSPFREAIEAMNAAPCPVLSLDIPSGLHGDTGRVLGAAVRAQATVTFIGLKQGLFTGVGPDHCGRLAFDGLGVPEQVLEQVAPAARCIDLKELTPLLGPRRRTAHKGHFGHVLVVGGERGMGGAARLAGEAAARVGAGLVSVATRPAHVPAIMAGRPELMAHGVEGAADLGPLLERATVVAIGPGLGRGPWGRDLFARVLDSGLPLVVDADALNLLALEPVLSGRWVLTPHPGEAARLLGCSAREVEEDRFAAVKALHARFGGVSLLKGGGTLVQGADGPPWLCGAGNPGMAGGGMGDVLTGIIAGLLAQGLTPLDAARLGACLHGSAADRAARSGERGLLASDLMDWLRYLVNPGWQGR